MVQSQPIPSATDRSVGGPRLFGILFAGLLTVAVGRSQGSQPSVDSPGAGPSRAQATEKGSRPTTAHEKIDLDELRRRVRREHRPGDAAAGTGRAGTGPAGTGQAGAGKAPAEQAPKKVDRFRVQMTLQALGRNADNHFEAQLDVKFASPRRMRYRIDEGERVIERGTDGKSLWQRLGVDEPTVDLRKREYANDRRALAQELRLARQLLELLEPDRILGSLEQATIDRIKRGKERRAAWLVSGRIADFPVYGRSDGAGGNPWERKGPVALDLLFDTETSRLLALRARPLDDKGKPQTRYESVSVDEWQTVLGIRIPRTLTILGGDLQRKVGQKFVVRLLQIDLDADLPEAAFRPSSPF